MSEQAPAASENVDPLAVSLALAGASRERADAFLDDQRHHLHEQLKQIHLDIFEKWLGVLLRLATLAVGLALATGLAIAVWEASRAEGTVVDAFSVPPRLAADGVSGEVVAADLTGMIEAVRSSVANNTISNTQEIHQDRLEDIKVEIPETGISLGQAWRYLRLWLGHERHLTGNLRVTSEGKAVLTVLSNGVRIAIVTGEAADLETLEQKAAEQVFSQLDPHNMVLYLRVSGRLTEALAAAQRAANLASSPAERADAHGLWASMIRTGTGDIGQAQAHARTAQAIYPKFQAIPWEMMWEAALSGHDEEALHHALAVPGFKPEDQPESVRGKGSVRFLKEATTERDMLQGAFAEAATEDECQVCSQAHQILSRAENAARAHDMAASRALLQQIFGSEQRASSDWRSVQGIDVERVHYYWSVNLGNWPAAVADARAYEANTKAKPVLNAAIKAMILRVRVLPLIATALAKSGDAAGAEAAIAQTPEDCYDCIRARAAVAAAAKQWSRADAWFAQAVHDGPSLPLAYSDWGQSLLERRQPDAAIEKFKLANQKGPRFADALEGWGEALMAKNQSHLALAKFAEADKYAPNWGRLHVKWGEALVYAGRRNEATAQFARAAALDLKPSEKSELTSFGHV